MACDACNDTSPVMCTLCPNPGPVTCWADPDEAEYDTGDRSIGGFGCENCCGPSHDPCVLRLLVPGRCPFCTGLDILEEHLGGQ